MREVRYHRQSVALYHRTLSIGLFFMGLFHIYRSLLPEVMSEMRSHQKSVALFHISLALGLFFIGLFLHIHVTLYIVA